MLKITLSEFLKGSYQYLTYVDRNNEPLSIQTDENSGVVIMSLKEYTSLMTTHHEKSFQVNEKRLDGAISRFKNSNSKK